MKVAINPNVGNFQITKECAEYMAERSDENAIHILEFNAKRNNFVDDWYGGLHNGEKEEMRKSLLLIEAIEATSQHHNCKIVEIPDNTDFFIYSDSDGSETIHEKHQVWF